MPTDDTTYLFFDAELVHAAKELWERLNLTYRDGTFFVWHFEDGTTGIKIWLSEKARISPDDIPGEYRGWPVRVEPMQEIIAAS